MEVKFISKLQKYQHYYNLCQTAQRTSLYISNKHKEARREIFDHRRVCEELAGKSNSTIFIIGASAVRGDRLTSDVMEQLHLLKKHLHIFSFP
jgi:hypothetical protein